MRKIAFVHDHKFILYNMEAYSSGKLTSNSFDRYLKHSKNVTIISRAVSVDHIDNQCLNKITTDNIYFIPFPCQSNFINRFIFRFFYMEKLKKILKSYDFLIIRVPSEIGFLSARCALELGIPYVCEVVACPSDAMIGFNTLKSKLYRNIIVNEMSDVVYKANGAIYVTETFLQSKYPTNGYEIYASNVEISEVKNFKKLINKNHFNIVSTGNLDSCHKGYSILYKALSILDRKIDYNLNIYLVGAGSKFKNNNLNFKKINVIYTGSLSRSDLFSLLDSSDLYLQPSNQEGLPRATIEAMSRGLPCIVSDAGGLPELIQKDLVHSKYSPEDLSILIIKLLSNPIMYINASKFNIKKSSEFLTHHLELKRFRFFNTFL